MATVHRDYKLANELYYVVLRLVQLRDLFLERANGYKITSVKYNGVELGKSKRLSLLNLAETNLDSVKSIAKEIGYKRTKCIPGSKIVSKIDVTLNGKNTSIRCLNYTDRALVNHSHRRKYEMVCERIGLDIKVLDRIINDYWICRKLEIFNEDCYPYSSLNPFLEHKTYLSELLTFMAFHTFNYDKPYYSDEFIAENIDQIIDYIDPWDESTWTLYYPTNYLETIWPSLCFSMRDRKGMPSDKELLNPENADLMKWVEVMGGKYKGALHIRIKKFDASKYEKDFKSQFEYKHREILNKIRKNQGDLDEYLVKLFLVECREKDIRIPLGCSSSLVKVDNVGGIKDKKYNEYLKPDLWLDWNNQSPKMVIYMCERIGAVKGQTFFKADVYVNHIGISLKSERCSPPSIINTTTRDKILRVMKTLNQPIAPIDHIIDRYWNIRLNGGTEDVCNGDSPDNPFCVSESGETNLGLLKPLLNYFAFKGSGTKDSPAPADFILSTGLPTDISTWTYYDESNFVELNWDNFVFSIRSHNMPKKLLPEMLPWVREVDGTQKGQLNVRIKKLKSIK